MKIFLLCVLVTLVILYVFLLVNGYPLVRKYDYEAFLPDENDLTALQNKNMEVYFSFKQSKKVNWIIPWIYDNERFGSPYQLDLHLNSETITEASNVRLELTTEDGQHVTYLPKNGKIILETGPHLTVYSRHIDPLESSSLNWDAIKKITIQLKFTILQKGQEMPIETTHQYTKKSSPHYIGNPIYKDIFLTR